MVPEFGKDGELKMVAKLVCASALIAASGAAQGAGFFVNLCDAGGIAGSLGAPITWTPSAQTSYQASSSLVAPSALDIDGNIKLQNDNYFGMDPVGQSYADGDPNTKGDGYSSNASLTSPGQGFAAGNAFGVWGSTVPIPSGTNFTGGADSLFIMNLTLRVGSSDPTTAGLLVQLQDGGTAGQFLFGTLKFGAANATNAGVWGQSYYLDFKKTTTTTATSSTTFNNGTNYQIYIVAAVPTPGAAGLAGLAGLVSLRRRRA